VVDTFLLDRVHGGFDRALVSEQHNGQFFICQRISRTSEILVTIVGSPVDHQGGLEFMHGFDCRRKIVSDNRLITPTRNRSRRNDPLSDPVHR
jgi:hypothetical protein